MDEGILGFLRQQVIKGINIEEIIGLFRPHGDQVKVIR
jgi:hypothetical protein